MTTRTRAHRVRAEPRPPRPEEIKSRRRSTHDPFRPAQRMKIPQLAARARPVEGPVNVLAYLDRYPPHQNAGAEWMAHHLLRDTAQRGHRAVVVTATPSRYEFEGVDVRPIRDLDEAACEADVMVSHLAWTQAAEECADTHRIPIVYILHNDQQVRFWKLTHLDVTVMVANSRWVAAANQSWKGKQFVVRPPVFLADYETDPPAADREFVTLVNVYPEKGSELFYTLARSMPERRFLGVQGAYGNQQLPTRQDRNVVWQPQTGQIVTDVYARTRVLLMPSAYESWGRVAVEAMCSGVPVIAHPTPGLLESLGEAGIFVTREDPEAWAIELARLDDPAVYAEWSARARERAEHLDRQSKRDLDTWDEAIRLAASAREPRRRR